jgi:glycosyltransferase involved in cell wall biosynthesis
MKITIIIAVFNGAGTIQECLNSIKRQSYLDYEIIVMDGGSTDRTKDVLLRNNDEIAYWESNKDRGIAHAWNKALDLSKGDWILFLGADDYLFDENVLSDMAPVLESDKCNDLVYGEIQFKGGEYDGKFFGEPCDLGVLKRRMNFPHTATFHRKCFFDELGRFDEKFKIAIDYELVLRKKNLMLSYFKRPVSVMGGEGVSSTLIAETHREFRLAQLKNQVSSSYVIQFWYVYYRCRHALNRWLSNL